MKLHVDPEDDPDNPDNKDPNNPSHNHPSYQGPTHFISGASEHYPNTDSQYLTTEQQYPSTDQQYPAASHSNSGWFWNAEKNQWVPPEYPGWRWNSETSAWDKDDGTEQGQDVDALRGLAEYSSDDDWS